MNQVNQVDVISITRSFNFPKDKVFNAFSNPQAMAAWWGPADNPVTVLELDFRQGGLFHYSMDMMGQKVWGRFQYARIEKPDLLEFLFTFANANADVVRMPFSDQWPMEVYNRLEFEEEQGITTIRMTAWPVNATYTELTMFRENRPNMEHGFGGSLDQLGHYLSKTNNI